MTQIPLFQRFRILNMRKFDYVMIITIYGEKITSQGSKSEFFYQIWSKDYVTGVKTLRNQTYAYQEYWC